MRSTLALFAFAFATAAPVAAAELVPVSAFRGIELRGGGEVIVRPGRTQRVTLLAGSRRFTNVRVERNGRLVIDACNEQCPRNYDLRIEIQSPTVPSVAISGGGTIIASSGFAVQPQLSAAVNGGGEINLRALAAGNISAAVNGGGLIRAGRTASLSAAVNGGGEVRFSGNPQVSSAVRGGGSVTREN